MKKSTLAYSAPPRKKIINIFKQKSKKKSPLFYLIAAFFLLNCFEYSAQSLAFENETLSPRGVFDTIGDRFGNLFTLNDIIINDDIRISRGGSANRNNLLCNNSGYYNLYFEDGALGPVGMV